MLERPEPLSGRFLKRSQLIAVRGVLARLLHSSHQLPHCDSDSSSERNVIGDSRPRGCSVEDLNDTCCSYCSDRYNTTCDGIDNTANIAGHRAVYSPSLTGHRAVHPSGFARDGVANVTTWPLLSRGHHSRWLLLRGDDHWRTHYLGGRICVCKVRSDSTQFLSRAFVDCTLLVCKCGLRLDRLRRDDGSAAVDAGLSCWTASWITLSIRPVADIGIGTAERLELLVTSAIRVLICVALRLNERDEGREQGKTAKKL